MMSYAKILLKEFLSNKRKVDENETLALNEDCNAILPKTFLHKLKGSRSFSILYLIGSMSFERALYKLGTNVYLMPLSVCKKLDVREMKYINIYL